MLVIDEYSIMAEIKTIQVQGRGVESFADDLVTGLGVVFSRAATILRSVETKPMIGRFAYYIFLAKDRLCYDVFIFVKKKKSKNFFDILKKYFLFQNFQHALFIENFCIRCIKVLPPTNSNHNTNS